MIYNDPHYIFPTSKSMGRFSFIFFIIWIMGIVLRLFMRGAVRTRTHQGPGQSGSWRQNPWGQKNPSSNPSRSPYEVLGVHPNASQKEINTSYRRLVQQYHPDKMSGLGPELREVAEQRMKEINSAYQRLKNRNL